MSMIFELGLPSVSIKNKFGVLLYGLFEIFHLTWIYEGCGTPDAGSVCASKLYVPP